MPNGAIIIINTRYHYDDICGWLLKQQGKFDIGEEQKWDVLSIPAWLDAKSSELLGLPDQPNVLYMLFDKDNNEFYIGEAKKLKTRLTQDRPEIPNWTHFRYSVLPPELSPFRVQLERMVIRDFASILPSSKIGFDSIKISECQFKNKKIDN